MKEEEEVMRIGTRGIPERKDEARDASSCHGEGIGESCEGAATAAGARPSH